MYKKGGWHEIGMETDLSNLFLAGRKHGMYPGLTPTLTLTPQLSLNSNRKSETPHK